MKGLAFIVVAVAALAASGAVTAHHAANAVYDVSKLAVMKGELKRVEWVNPHAKFHFYEVDAAGKRVSEDAWVLETGGPTAMRRMGMSGAGMMKVGEIFTVSYRPARNGGKLGLMTILEFPDGRKFSQLPVN